MDLIERQVAIDVEGIDEQIRCEMCKNPMHTDRGCDGNCKYDEKLYERIMQILGERIKPLPSVQPELCECVVSAVAVEEMLKNLLPERGMWEIEGDDAKTDICETIHDALDGLWRLPFVKPDYDCVLKQFSDCTYDTTGCSDCVIKTKIKIALSAQPDNSCDGCKYENADDGVLVPCGFCKRTYSDNYERRTDEAKPERYN